MDIKQEIADLPRAIEEMLEKGRPEYESLVRRTRWGDGPLYVTGSGASWLVSQTAVYAFEGLLGWPVVVRSTPVFSAYGMATLRPRSVLLAVSESGKSEALLEAVRAARSRGASILALTQESMSPLAQMADGVFLVRAGESSGRIKGLILAQATLSYIAVVAARTLKRHHPQLDALEEEFEKLPRHIEWVLNQLPDAVRSVASGLKGSRRVGAVGAGFYHPAALQAAFMMREISGIETEGFESSEFQDRAALGPDAALAILSGSRCRLKKQVHQLAAQARSTKAKIISITDTNDRELADLSTMAVLLPNLTEPVASTLAVVLVASIANQLAREQKGGPAQDDRSAGSSAD